MDSKNFTFGKNLFLMNKSTNYKSQITQINGGGISIDTASLADKENQINWIFLPILFIFISLISTIIHFIYPYPFAEIVISFQLCYSYFSCKFFSLLTYQQLQLQI